MMRKNPILFALCLFAVIQPAVAEEVLFRVLEDTPAWRSGIGAPRVNSNITRIIPKGSVVSNIATPFVDRIDGNRSFVQFVFFENVRYSIAANSITAIDTEEIFDESFLTSSETQSKNWANAGLLALLRNGNRDVILLDEQEWIDLWADGEEVWYTQASVDRSLNITQATVDMGGFSRDNFWIKRIERTADGYRVTVTWNMHDAYYYAPELRNKKVNLPSRDEASAFDLYFIIDGDYMDVYYATEPDSSDMIFSTSFARFDPEMRDQANGILGYRPGRPLPYHPERLTFWPRRADGSTDYPPPEGANLAFQAGHKTTDRLRVRENPDTGSEIVTTLDTGTQVQLLETGTTETIGGISAPWVKVQSENGFTGWAFSGYLEPLAPEQENPDSVNVNPTNLETENPKPENVETENLDSANPEPENVETQNLDSVSPENGKGNFPVLMLSIIGGAVLVSGIAAIVVFTLFAKRRKGKAAKP